MTEELLLTRRFKILCIDDEPSVLQALTRVLSGDFQILTATSAEKAREILQSNLDTAVVLTDQSMPVVVPPVRHAASCRTQV